MKPVLPVLVHGLVLCLLNALSASAQDIYAARYKAVFTTPPCQVPTAKVPDGLLHVGALSVKHCFFQRR